MRHFTPCPVEASSLVVENSWLRAEASLGHTPFRFSDDWKINQHAPASTPFLLCPTPTIKLSCSLLPSSVKHITAYYMRNTWG